MDTRTGYIYPSFDAARAAGVDEQDLARVAPVPRVVSAVRVETGPFKGRVYEVIDGRRGRRLRHLERSKGRS